MWPLDLITPPPIHAVGDGVGEAVGVVAVDRHRAVAAADIAALKAAVPLESIVAPHVALRRQGRELVGSCPFHNEKTPSFTVHDDNHFHCFGCGAHGDVIDFMQQVDGLAFPEAIERLQNLAGEPQPQKSPHASGDKEKEKKKKKVGRAREIWRAAIPMDHPDAELGRRYLQRRGITIPAPATIRFTPVLWHDLERQPFPALVCAVAIWPEGQVSGVWRIYLDPRSGKAPVEKPKLGLGRAAGGAVRLARAAEHIAVGEGVETSLTTQMVTGLPTWAALSTSGLKALILPPLPLAAEVMIAADNDQNGRGQAAAEMAAERWCSEGRAVRIALPPDIGSDFNDLIMERCF